MNKRILYIALAIALLLIPLAYYLLWPSDEARIRSLIRTCATAAENKDTKTLMSPVSYQYGDSHGMSYLMLSRLMDTTLKDLSEINVDLRSITVTVEGKKATAVMSLRVSARFSDGQKAYLIGSFQEGADLTLYLQRTGPVKWEVMSSRYVLAGG